MLENLLKISHFFIKKKYKLKKIKFILLKINNFNLIFIFTFIFYYLQMLRKSDIIKKFRLHKMNKNDIN